jgi:protoporphyrinogen/coproporphyrinogen III oxidase
MHDVAIIGAGISGLTCGYYLKRAGLDVIVLEASKPGGAVQTNRVGPYLLEAGPNSLRDSGEHLIKLISDLGLSDQIVKSSPLAKKRYLLRNGKLLPTPTNPLGIFKGGFLPLGQLMKLIGESIPPKGTMEDETIREFASRRLSPWIADKLIDPMITGIYAGDIAKLSMRSSFPKFWDYEKQYGSVLKGVNAARKAKPKNSSKRDRSIFSFKDGLHTLTDSMRNALGESLRTNTDVSRLERTHSGWKLNDAEARAVVIANQAYNAAHLVEQVSPQIANELRSIYYPHVSVVSLAFKRDRVQHPLDGFGFLVPSGEKRDILGCIFSSSLWEGRAPKDEALLTVMMGGTKREDMRSWSEDQLIAAALREVGSLLGISGKPVFTHITRWEKAIPQYHLGHHRTVESLAAFEHANQGLHFLGNYRGGIAIGSCVENATELTARLVQARNN